MNIRRFRKQDAPEIVRLFRDTIRRVNIKDYSLEQVRAWAPDEIDVAAWEGRLSSSSQSTYVAEQDGQIVGFADFEASGHINCFYVHADHQREGVGSSLLAEIENEAVRCGRRRIFVDVSITARPFFEKHGYRVIQRQQVERRGVTLTNFAMEKNAEAFVKLDR